MDEPWRRFGRVSRGNWSGITPRRGRCAARRNPYRGQVGSVDACWGIRTDPAEAFSPWLAMQAPAGIQGAEPTLDWKPISRDLRSALRYPEGTIGIAAFAKPVLALATMIGAPLTRCFFGGDVLWGHLELTTL